MRKGTRYIHSGVKPDGFINYGAQIFHVLHIVKGRSSSLANYLEDLLSKAFQNVRILGKHIDGKCDAVRCLEILNGGFRAKSGWKKQTTTYCVTSSKKDIENFIT